MGRPRSPLHTLNHAIYTLEQEFTNASYYSCSLNLLQYYTWKCQDKFYMIWKRPMLTSSDLPKWQLRSSSQFSLPLRTIGIWNSGPPPSPSHLSPYPHYTRPCTLPGITWGVEYKGLLRHLPEFSHLCVSGKVELLKLPSGGRQAVLQSTCYEGGPRPRSHQSYLKSNRVVKIFPVAGAQRFHEGPPVGWYIYYCCIMHSWWAIGTIL